MEYTLDEKVRYFESKYATVLDALSLVMSQIRPRNEKESKASEYLMQRINSDCTYWSRRLYEVKEEVSKAPSSAVVELKDALEGSI